MKPAAPKSVGVVANVSKPEAPAALEVLLRLLDEHRVRLGLETQTAALAGRPELGRPLAEIGPEVDLVIVLGGDGTMLRVARELTATSTPILGVNLGGLGFLTSVRLPELTAALEEILQGRYQLSERQTLQTAVLRGGLPIETHPALNDVVISRSTFSRVVRLRLTIDGELLTEYVCDGMIFATATGSTAYSLSAGGPILLPAARALVITPICPHALSNRSVIAGAESCARCQVVSAPGDLLLTVDGQVQRRLEVGDTVEVRPAANPVRLLTPTGHSYFELLRQKLKWSGANV